MQFLRCLLFSLNCAQRKVWATLMEKVASSKSPAVDFPSEASQMHFNQIPLPLGPGPRRRSYPLRCHYRSLILSLRFQVRGCRQLGDYSRNHHLPRQPASAETRREELRVDHDRLIASSPGPASSFFRASRRCCAVLFPILGGMIATKQSAIIFPFHK